MVYLISLQHALSFRICAWMIFVLQWFTRPAWTYDASLNHIYDDHKLYPSFNIKYIDSTAYSVIMILLMMYITYGFILEVFYTSDETSLSYHGMQWKMNTLRKRQSSVAHNQNNPNNLFSDSFVARNSHLARVLMPEHIHFKRIFRYFIIFVNISSICLYIYTLCIRSLNSILILSTVSNSLAIIYILWFDPRSFRKCRILVRTLHSFCVLLLVLASFVLSFAIIGPVLFGFDSSFENDGKNEQYFGNFGLSVWTLFVAITSSSYPNQMVPSVQDSRLSFLFFFFLITIGSFLILKLILITVFFKFDMNKNLQDEAEQECRRENLELAFSVLDVYNVGRLTYDQVGAAMMF